MMSDIYIELMESGEMQVEKMGDNEDIRGLISLKIVMELIL